MINTSGDQMADVLFDLEVRGEASVVSGVRRQLAAVVVVHCAHAVDDISLVVSELVANAVEHSRGSIRVRATHGSGTLRIEVHDGSPGRPVIGRRSQDADSGRGLLIVAALAESWGFEPAGPGKVVWAEVSC